MPASRNQLASGNVRGCLDSSYRATAYVLGFICASSSKEHSKLPSMSCILDLSRLSATCTVTYTISIKDQSSALPISKVLKSRMSHCDFNILTVDPLIVTSKSSLS